MIITGPTGLLHGLGRLVDRLDTRDRLFAETAHPEVMAAERLPETDLRNLLPPCWDQERLSSCEGHGGAALAAFYLQGFQASRLGIYGMGRAMEGTFRYDNGMETRTLMKVLMNGIYPEDVWPYDVDKVLIPPPSADPAMPIWRIGGYSRMTTEDEMLACLSSRNPFVLSFTLPDYFSTATYSRGVLPLPAGPITPIGDHLVTAVGHTTSFRSHPDFIASGYAPEQVEDTMLLIRNSWSTSYGLLGHFWFPSSMALSDGNDIWAVHPATAGMPMAGGVPISGHFV